ncbi:AbrB/MazE/SpoVT family DNA-binding domain-containing protein [Candidatus Woesearchaeota archaeon]|nr:AbrB/MazE/SpoVT family DNA-binding domain-containing protein [Candidatus Woesearchaeota archaeon]
MIDLATVSSKGQVVIPRRMRAGLGFSKNTKLILVSDKGSFNEKDI